MKQPSEKVQLLLKEVVEHFDREDITVRERQIRQWKKLKYYWDGFYRIWWSETNHDWRVYDANQTEQVSDNGYYDKPVNVFKAYLESIIAALSITIPSVKCAPDDADNALDLATAKAGDKIADLVAKHNDVSLLWLHALFIYCTEGMVACYNYPKEDYDYGTYTENKYEDVEDTVDIHVCPTCGNELPIGLKEEIQDEYAPEDILLQSLAQGDNFCTACMQEVMPELQQKKIIVTRISGTINKPKARQCLEAYGGLFVKVPNYAMKQADCPYLIYSYETHFSNVIERYPHLRDKFNYATKFSTGPSATDYYGRWGRLSTQYYGEIPINTPTVRNAWIRCSGFNILKDEEDVKELKRLFPNGVKVVLVNDTFAEACNENLDDCWTLTHNPLSDYLHHDPLGLVLTSIQEITNELISLILQTIEHGIPQTFADPAVVNFDAYRNSEVSPGAIYPTKPVSSSKSIGDAFYEVRTATLSGEVLPFGQEVQQMGQLVSGALPSLFGGMAPGQGKTAAQYSMSRAQALQRLQTTWKMFNIWWKTIFSKVIPAYIKDVKDDERHVIQSKSGDWVNVFIRRAELEGKIGSVELESSENLPATWAAQKDTIMQLLQAGNPAMMNALMAPENIDFLQDAIGITGFNVPGEDDRAKQYEEIKQLLDSEPIMNEMGQEVATVQVEPLVDNHQIEADICRSFLVGDAGRLAKIENPAGYKNVLLHMQEHVMVGQQLAMEQMMAQQPPPQNGGNEKPQPMAQKLPKGQSNATA